MAYSNKNNSSSTDEDDITYLPFHNKGHSPLPEIQVGRESFTPTKKGGPHNSFLTVLLVLAFAIGGFLFYSKYQGSELSLGNPTPLKPVPTNTRASSPQNLSPIFPSPSASSAQPSSNNSPETNPTPSPAKNQTQIAQLYQAKNNQETTSPGNPALTATPPAVAGVGPAPTPAPIANVAPTATPSPAPLANAALTADTAPATAATGNDSAISQIYEATSLNMQQVDVALFPKDTQLQPQTLHLDVPIVHEKRLLSFTKDDILDFTKIAARIQETRAKQIALQKEMRDELADYNALIQKGTPEAVLNTDSPSLINNTNSQ